MIYLLKQNMISWRQPPWFYPPRSHSHPSCGQAPRSSLWWSMVIGSVVFLLFKRGNVMTAWKSSNSGRSLSSCDMKSLIFSCLYIPLLWLQISGFGWGTVHGLISTNQSLVMGLWHEFWPWALNLEVRHVSSPLHLLLHNLVSLDVLFPLLYSYNLSTVLFAFQSESCCNSFRYFLADSIKTTSTQPVLTNLQFQFAPLVLQISHHVWIPYWVRWRQWQWIG